MPAKSSGLQWTGRSWARVVAATSASKARAAGFRPARRNEAGTPSQTGRRVARPSAQLEPGEQSAQMVRTSLTESRGHRFGSVRSSRSARSRTGSITGSRRNRAARVVPTVLDMGLVPSASYSITVRLEVPADGLPASQLTGAVESVGGMVTAFDVTAAARRPPAGRPHVRRARRRPRRADRRRRSAPSTASTVGKVSDRTFLLHLGGKIEVQSKVAAAHPRRPVDGLHARASPGSAGRSPSDPRTSGG